MALKIAVLGSTKGADLQGLIDEIGSGALDAQIVLVLSDRKQAFILERAKKHGIRAVFVDPKAYANRTEFDRALLAELEKSGTELVLLIGYMRIAGPELVRKYAGKMMNIHPSLLPEFAGGMDKDVHAAVLAAGKKETGCTLHFVTDDVDKGPIILQKKVPVLQGDTPETLKARVQKAEQEVILEGVRRFMRNELD
ncbi:MAG: phosphoribosylglycinamide formyltransferase [Candidatus Diapherotrites archaeon]|nr:phosphoribosylglycinamide formyltransferase [Candidatus Micrarchaeota archaeon]